MPKQYDSAYSKLLTDIQNKGVINALPKNCTALVTTVAIMRVTDTSVVLFGVATIERDAKTKKYFFRFYNMNNMILLIQREIKKSVGVPFNLVQTCFIEMEIHQLTILFEFIKIFRGVRLCEFIELKRALRGDLKRLKKNAEMRYYADDKYELWYERNGFLKRFCFGSKKYELKKTRKPIDEGEEAKQKAKSALTNWASDPDYQNILNEFGVDHENVFKNKDACEELEQLVAKYGGTDKFKQNIAQHGLGIGGEDENLPASPTLTSVPKTADKLVVDKLTAFEPAKLVEMSKNDDLCMSMRLEDAEEFLASELIPGINASSPVAKSSRTTGELAGTSRPAEPDPPEKEAKPATKVTVEKWYVPDPFVVDLNRRMQKIDEKVKKQEAAKKFKREQKLKAKMGQPVQTTPEQTPEKEAPMQTEKTPVKEASTTPEKNPSSDTTDETESHSDSD